MREAYLRDGAVLTLGTAQVRFSLPGEVAQARRSAHTQFGALVGLSAAMRECFARLENAATTSRPVLLEGESGTGKTLAGEALHELGTRAKHGLASLNCASLPAETVEAALFGRERDATGAARIGAFEEAGEGTVFLEEVGELPLKAQGRLVQVLEEGVVQRGHTSLHVRARLLTSSRRDLRTAVNEGHFRTGKHRAVDARLTYGAAREQALAAFEKDYFTALLGAHRGKVSQAAKAADIDRVYLYRLLRRHGIKTRE